MRLSLLLLLLYIGLVPGGSATCSVPWSLFTEIGSGSLPNEIWSMSLQFLLLSLCMQFVWKYFAMSSTLWRNDTPRHPFSRSCSMSLFHEVWIMASLCVWSLFYQVNCHVRDHSAGYWLFLNACSACRWQVKCIHVEEILPKESTEIPPLSADALQSWTKEHVQIKLSLE